MLIFNCTKAATDFFSSTKKGKKISAIETAPHKTISESAECSKPHQWQWLVHTIKVKGKNVIIVMDYQSRFGITLSALEKGDDIDFLNNFEHHLTVHVLEMMASINADSQAIDYSLEHYRHQHNSRAFYLRGDRSVQSHVNDVASHFRSWADEMGEVPIEVDLIAFDDFANQLPRKRKAEKDYFVPQHEFLHAWLTRYGEYNVAQAEACIEKLKAKERADFSVRHPNLIPPSKPTEALHSTDTHAASSNNVISLDTYRKK